jgi:hypothetical protein
LLTLTHNNTTKKLTRTPYSGNIRQQWRIRHLGEAGYEFKLESTHECLVPLTTNAMMGACGAAGGYWQLETLRLRSEERPAIYRLKSPNNLCLHSSNANPTLLGVCDDNANWYIEPVGYGERSKPVEYEVRALLIVKPVTNVPNLTLATIPEDIIAAARTSFERDVAIWFERMTDGRVLWIGESVISPDPITSFSFEGGNYLPAAVNVPTDVERYVTRGKYDTVAVFFSAGNVPGGWGWGPGSSPASNYSLWVTVHGGTTPANQWISGNNEPTEVFIHEPMHGYDSYIDQFGIPLPTGYLHGTEFNQYARENDGWMPWYRDYWLGTIIGSDDTYRGYGPRMFRTITPRDYALTKPE